MDLRSSTEELYFMEAEKEKANVDRDTFTQQVCIIFTNKLNN